MAPTGEPGAWVAPGVHVGRATQVLDPCRVKHHKAVADCHLGEWVALAGIGATRQGDVFFYLHGYIVQQTHVQRNYQGYRCQIQGFS